MTVDNDVPQGGRAGRMLLAALLLAAVWTLFTILFGPSGAWAADHESGPTIGGTPAIPSTLGSAAAQLPVGQEAGGSAPTGQPAQTDARSSAAASVASATRSVAPHAAAVTASASANGTI